MQKGSFAPPAVPQALWPLLVSSGHGALGVSEGRAFRHWRKSLRPDVRGELRCLLRSSLKALLTLDTPWGAPNRAGRRFGCFSGAVLFRTSPSCKSSSLVFKYAVS